MAKERVFLQNRDRCTGLYLVMPIEQLLFLPSRSTVDARQNGIQRG